MAISNQFKPYGGTFSFENSTNFPCLAPKGSPTRAFELTSGGQDWPANTNQNVGNWFLTGSEVFVAPPPLIMRLDDPVPTVSGVIIDVDGSDKWVIQARGTNDQLLGSPITLTSSSPGAGDGLAAPWSFSFSSNAIYSIRMSFTGATNGVNVGFAFDNFTIPKASASVVLSNLFQTYDGTARRVTATTIPPGLQVIFSYDGSPDAPTNVGNYTVIGEIVDLKYEGSATNTLVVVPATVAITLSNIAFLRIFLEIAERQKIAVTQELAITSQRAEDMTRSSLNLKQLLQEMQFSFLWLTLSQDSLSMSTSLGSSRNTHQHGHDSRLIAERSSANSSNRSVVSMSNPTWVPSHRE